MSSLKTGMIVKNTFNSVEWNILLILYFRFERHFLFFFFLKHKKEKREMRKRTTLECQQEAEQKRCEENTSLQLHTVAVFPSGRYAVTSSLLAFILFFLNTNTGPTQVHTLGVLIGYLCLGENPTEKL